MNTATGWIILYVVWLYYKEEILYFFAFSQPWSMIEFRFRNNSVVVVRT